MPLRLRHSEDTITVHDIKRPNSGKLFMQATNMLTGEFVKHREKVSVRSCVMLVGCLIGLSMPKVRHQALFLMPSARATILRHSAHSVDCNAWQISHYPWLTPLVAISSPSYHHTVSISDLLRPIKHGSHVNA